MSLVRANNVYELLSRNKSNEPTPPRTPVQDAPEAVSYHDVPYEQAFQQGQQQLSGPLVGVLNFEHYKVNDLTRRNATLTEEVQSLNDKLEKKASAHAEQLNMWGGFPLPAGRAVGWRAKLNAKHEGHRQWTRNMLARRKRRIDELIAAAVRERDVRGQDTKIFRRMATLRGIEFRDLDKKTRMLLNEKFQLQAHLRFERKQADEIRSKLGSAKEATETWRSKYDAEQNAHRATQGNDSGNYDCEFRPAGPVAATALAASETKAREEAASRRAEDNKLLSAEVVDLKSALEQSQADCNQMQTKLTKATKQAATEVRNRKVADKQRETAQRKVEQLRDQLAETTQEHQSAIEEIERLKAKSSKLAAVMSG
ncbi:hypothetical protein Slin15195_G073950 [Septoria linicola]|uniref:Uncharacterized protein n=1 Tax=Septoria linicola TaxID=215465 RepID=A0A9Q9EJS5_9PEZI|nr:hypothetical protein Slin14017_G035080 [Septoria linicola]USW54076.1 hypothetical protein Slin15195_G073950 [Septoria linicola]